MTVHEARRERYTLLILSLCHLKIRRKKNSLKGREVRGREREEREKERERDRKRSWIFKNRTIRDRDTK